MPKSTRLENIANGIFSRVYISCFYFEFLPSELMQIIIVAAYFQDIGVAIYRLIRCFSHLCCLHTINIQQCLHEKCELNFELFIPSKSCLVTPRVDYATFPLRPHFIIPFCIVVNFCIIFTISINIFN